ncbi:diguanylate cyclase domain-containing protein [Saccharothrix violaceirubra]|uniref:Diguanylate cyclase (GGDEF)-like protein/PAS domain S-box-containing protein n=1 Tax=Saccharothrix violaceirubra TaxID=413306 RepID=A0A7W7T1M6_9PSEU|nr:diguanylate cyclase [Saccharothrix violaceirubra]MBB4964422.1 diguanylate cyclase (GGDEF)-like protein/PAS domain S-box-containing protein [Saccharothrix violaceirubra]
MRWARALTATTREPLARGKLRGHLDRHVDRLVELLAAPAFDPAPATEVGEWLAAARFADPGPSLALLGTLLPGPVDRVAALLGAVASGHAAAHRREAAVEAERLRRVADDADAVFRKVFSSATAGIALFDIAGTLVESNRALAAMLGPDLFPPADLDALRAEWTRMLLADRDDSHLELALSAPDGDPLWTNVALSVVRGGDGGIRYRMAVVDDVTEQRVLQDYLRHQALHDVLTGLPNRQAFLPRLEEVLGRPGSITLCYLDVESVAIVNDGLGYESGDELLKVVAQRLRAAVAAERATVARIGGDEFVVLIEDSPATPGISTLATAFERALSEPVRLAGHGVGVSAGMGFVRTSARNSDAMALLRQAHTTLRRAAETGGKGQWGIYDAGEDERDRSRLSLIATMPGALGNGEIAIDYAPVAHEGRRIALTARLRWHDPEFGPVSHEQCLRFADELGLGRQLADWVLDEACSFALGEDVPVLVRLSPEQSRDPDLTAPVAEALRASGLAPDRLWLSLDARCLGLSDGLAAVEDNLTTLTDMGVRCLLHSFDCGLAQLSIVARHHLHGVELSPEIPRSDLCSSAAAAVLPLITATGTLVLHPRELYVQTP